METLSNMNHVKFQIIKKFKVTEHAKKGIDNMW